MHFAEPSWLWIGAASVAALCALIAWSERRRSRALARFVAARHLPTLTSSVSKPRRWLKHALRVLSVACLFTALARPQWGYHLEAQKREGVDVLFAVDSSKSMLAQDLRPSRLARAKLAVEDLVDKLPDARLGLVAFAGDAFLQTPLTADRVAFQQALDALDTSAIPIPGTNIESAVRVAKQAFRSEPEQRKIMVLLTDGEDLSDSVEKAAKDAADSGIVVHAIGIGTSAGSTIPLDDRGALLRDPAGQLVHSRLDEAALRKLSAATGGSYRVLGASSEGVTQLYRAALAQLPKQLHDVNMRKVFHERFQWPLGFGMGLLLVSLLLGEQRKRRGALRMAAAASCVIAAMSSNVGAQDRTTVTTYNDATQRYRKGDFKAAEAGYRAALATPDVALQQRAYYDLGNSLYREGQAQKPEAMERYKQAISAYESALALDAHDDDARFNRDFVRGKLKELQQQQAEQNKREDKKQDQQQDKTDSAAKSGKGSQGQQDDKSAANQHQSQAASGSEQDRDQQRKAADQGKGEQQGNGQAKQEQQGDGHEHEHEQQASAQAATQGTPHEAGQATGQGSSQADMQPGAAAVAGGLSREQAARLLDALQGDLQQLPSGYAAQQTHAKQDEQARKDW